MIIVGVRVAAILIVPLFSPANAEVSAETETAFVQYLDYDESTGHSNHTGPYEEFTTSYGKLSEYVITNGLELTGEAFEFYVTGMMQESDNSKWETLIAFPLK